MVCICFLYALYMVCICFLYGEYMVKIWRLYDSYIPAVDRHTQETYFINNLKIKKKCQKQVKTSLVTKEVKLVK